MLPAPCCMCCYCGSAVDAVFPPHGERERERETGKQGKGKREAGEGGRERGREEEEGVGGYDIQIRVKGASGQRLNNNTELTVCAGKEEGKTARQVERGKTEKATRQEKRIDRQESLECRFPVEHSAELL